MDIQFSSHLFGTADNQTPNPFVSNVNRVPTFSGDKWSLNCPLGKCGMDMSTREIEGETYLIFAYSIVYATETTSVEVDSFDLYLRNPLTTKVTFECAYRTEVEVSSSVFNVDKDRTIGTATQFGSLVEGFSLKLFTNRAMTTSVESENLFIGSSVYASVDWSVSSLSHLVNFYVDSCEIQFHEQKSLRIIDNNCYAATFGAEQLQWNKVVAQSSRFKFTSFIVGHGARSMKMQVTCNVKVCSVTENKCQQNLSVKDTDCSSSNNYAYKAKSYEWLGVIMD